MPVRKNIVRVLTELRFLKVWEGGTPWLQILESPRTETVTACTLNYWAILTALQLASWSMR
jgi:hypothetical protein